MNLVLPTPSTQPGPTYAQNNNDAFTRVDAHDHTSGNGVQVPTAGLNINAELDMNEFGFTDLGYSQYFNQASPLSAVTFPRTVYASGGELYYNDASSNQVQLTSGGAVNGTPGSITNLVAPAGVNWNSGALTYEFDANTTTDVPGSIDCGSIEIRETVAAGNGVTLSAPASLSSNYSITLPPALGANAVGVLDIDASGVVNITSSSTGNDVPKVNNAGSALEMGKLTQVNMGSLGQQLSSSSGTFSTTNTSATDVTNLSVTITTTGRPVMLLLVSDGTGGVNDAHIRVDSTGTSVGGEIYFIRGSTEIGQYGIGLIATGSGGTNYEVRVPLSSCLMVDIVAAGTYTYKLQASANASDTIYVWRAKLLAFEL